MNVIEKIRYYIVNELMSTKVEVTDTDSLYDNGILDSLKIVQLVIYLQNEFQLEISPAKMQVEDFETIQSIAEFVKVLQ